MDEITKYVTGMVRKDVLRTDRIHPFYAGGDDNQNIASLFNILTTYALNHPKVSYCQGMSGKENLVKVFEMPFSKSLFYTFRYSISSSCNDGRRSSSIRLFLRHHVQTELQLYARWNSYDPKIYSPIGSLTIL